MAYPNAAGRPQYSGNFIPEIWSGKLIENFYDATVLAAISNTDYEGEIRAYGDTVNIRTSPEVTIRTYVKGQTLQVENPDKAKLQLLIDKGEYFSCIEDDVEVHLPVVLLATSTWARPVLLLRLLRPTSWSTSLTWALCWTKLTLLRATDSWLSLLRWLALSRSPI